MKYKVTSLALFALLLPMSSYAIEASDIFKKVFHNVFMVVAKNTSGKVVAQGSGVKISRNVVVTNCHVVSDASTIVLSQSGTPITAKLKNRDVERDLCLLESDNLPESPQLLTRPSKQIVPGQKVYAVGAPLGLELTISDGIVSALRKADDGYILQTNAAISPGSSGGGLFDVDGYLIGITTSQMRKGQNLNFAVPAEWISQVALRERFEMDLSAKRKNFEARIRDANPNNQKDIIRLCDSHITQDERYIPAYAYKAQALHNLEDLANAERDYQRVVSLDAGNLDDYVFQWSAWTNLAIIYKKTGRNQLAMDAYLTSIEVLPAKDVISGFMKFVPEPSYIGKSLPRLQELTKIYPRSNPIWFQLGIASLYVKDFTAARKAFEQAVEIDPEDAGAWNALLVTVSKDEKEFNQILHYLAKERPTVYEKLSKQLGLNKMRN